MASIGIHGSGASSGGSAVIGSTAGMAPASSTVGITSGPVVSANTSRKGLIITNISAHTISLSFDTPAVLYSGITLLPGASFNMDQHSFDAREVQAIAAAAASNISIEEFI